MASEGEEEPALRARLREQAMHWQARSFLLLCNIFRHSPILLALDAGTWTNMTLWTCWRGMT